MDDLIRRQDVIRYLERAKICLDRKGRNLVDLFLEDIEQHIEPADRWIPADQKLPKEDGTYLVSGRWSKSGKTVVGESEFSVEDGYFQTAWNFEVQAWAYMPEPYKGGE